MNCTCKPGQRTGYIDSDKQAIVCEKCELTIQAITEDFTLDELNTLMRGESICVHEHTEQDWETHEVFCSDCGTSLTHLQGGLDE